MLCAGYVDNGEDFAKTGSQPAQGLQAEIRVWPRLAGKPTS